MLAGAPPRVATYGISDAQAADVGLMCGGTVRVFVHELLAREALDAARDAIAAGRPVALATLLDGPSAGARIAVTEDGVAGALRHTALLEDNVVRDARGFLDEGRSAIRRYSAMGETMGADLRVAIEAFATPPRMVVFGAIDFSAALARAATEIGYRVTIVDARAGLRAERALLRARRGRRLAGRRSTSPRPGARPARRGPRVHARPEVRRARAARGARQRRRLHRRARQPPHPRRPRAAPARGGRGGGRPAADQLARAAWTSAPARRPRRRWPCSARSSRCAPDARRAARRGQRADPPRRPRDRRRLAGPYGSTALQIVT